MMRSGGSRTWISISPEDADGERRGTWNGIAEGLGTASPTAAPSRRRSIGRVFFLIGATPSACSETSAEKNDPHSCAPHSPSRRSGRSPRRSRSAERGSLFCALFFYTSGHTSQPCIAAMHRSIAAMHRTISRVPIGRIYPLLQSALGHDSGMGGP